MLEWNLWCIKVYKQLQQGQNEDTQSQSWVNSKKIKNLSAYPIAGKWWGRKHFPFAALPVHMSLVQVNMLCSIDQGKCKDPPFDKDETCECPKTAFGLHSGGNTGVFNGVSMNLSFGAPSTTRTGKWRIMGSPAQNKNRAGGHSYLDINGICFDMFWHVARLRVGSPMSTDFVPWANIDPHHSPHPRCAVATLRLWHVMQ